MAGIISGVTNNLLGLQQLAAGRQDLEQRQRGIEDQKLAADYLRKFQSSAQSGAPDYNSLNEAIIRSPELSQHVLSGIGIQEKRQGQDAASFIAQAAQSVNNPEQFLTLANNRANYLQQNGRDPKDTLALIQKYQSGDVEGARNDLQGVAAALTNQGYLDKDLYAQSFGVNIGGHNAGRSEILDDGTVIQSTPTGPVVYSASGQKLTGDAAAKAVKDAQQYGAQIQAQRAGGRAEAVGQAQLGINPQIASAVDAAKAAVELGTKPGITAASTTAEEGAKNRNLYKTQAIATAENIPTLKRAIELQDKIATGGAANSARALANYLGSSSTDAGELNSLFNQNILGQLKSTFGGNPTEGERAALSQAQASYAQTGSINSKLLQNALKLADLRVKRGRAAAKTDKDTDTLDSIDSALSVDFSDSTTPAITPASKAKLTYDPTTGTFK